MSCKKMVRMCCDIMHAVWDLNHHKSSRLKAVVTMVLCRAYLPAFIIAQYSYIEGQLRFFIYSNVTFLICPLKFYLDVGKIFSVWL